MRYTPLLLILVFILSCQSEQEETKAQYGDITASVYASVQVEPLDYYTVYPLASGIIEKVFEDDGDSLSQGQLIAMISSNKSKLNVQDASINLQLFKENFKGKETILSNFLEDIELNLEKRKIDSINYTRQLNL